LRCWTERESERGIIPGKFRKRDGGKGPHFWHALKGEEKRGLAMSLQTPEKIRTLPRELYLKAKAELVCQTP
jgi:hypothetical protein